MAELDYEVMARVHGAAHASFIKAERFADLLPVLEAFCRDKVPPDYAKCIARSERTAWDSCDDSMDARRAQALLAEQQEVKKSVVNWIYAPATHAECEAVAPVIAARFQGIPAAADIASLCKRDKWPTAFVRCTIAKHPGCKPAANITYELDKLQGKVKGSGASPPTVH